MTVISRSRLHVCTSTYYIANPVFVSSLCRGDSLVLDYTCTSLCSFYYDLLKNSNTIYNLTRMDISQTLCNWWLLCWRLPPCHKCIQFDVPVSYLYWQNNLLQIRRKPASALQHSSWIQRLFAASCAAVEQRRYGWRHLEINLATLYFLQAVFRRLCLIMHRPTIRHQHIFKL